MNGLHLLVAVGLVLGALAARADKMPLPADTPPAFKAECAGCHVAFPPQLLSAPDWQRVMATLDKHYGDNASLDDKTRASIEEFLVRNARKPKKDVPVAAPADVPPRLTTSTWFKRKHHEVARSDWTHAKVKTPANCAACHTRAETGSFREREIVMPDGRRWES